MLNMVVLGDSTNEMQEQDIVKSRCAQVSHRRFVSIYTEGQILSHIIKQAPQKQRSIFYHITTPIFTPNMQPQSHYPCTAAHTSSP